MVDKDGNRYPLGRFKNGFIELGFKKVSLLSRLKRWVKNAIHYFKR